MKTTFSVTEFVSPARMLSTTSIRTYHHIMAERRRCRRRSCTTTSSIPRSQEDNALVRLAVASLTSLLDIARLRRTPPAIERRLSKVDPGDVEAIMRCISVDYMQHSYFVTGDIWEGIYSEDCFFGDPTVSFTGLQKWRQNLQLLVPFLEDPQIQLFSLDVLCSTHPVKLKADWRLSTYLKLPWRPFIDVLGSTEYTLDDASQQAGELVSLYCLSEENAVVRHIESWNISGTDALLQILRPSSGQERPQTLRDSQTS